MNIKFPNPKFNILSNLIAYVLLQNKNPLES